MAQLTRRNFVQVAAAASATAALAACGTTTTEPEAEGGDEGEAAPESEATAEPAGDIYAAPDASVYPIDVDGADVEALYSVEEIRAGWTKATNPNGVEIGCKDAAKIIQVNGLAFRDMNGDGKLDLWEDWRQTADARAAAIAAAMPYDECMKLMWHGGDEEFVFPGAEVEGAEEAVPHGLCVAGSRAGVSRLMTSVDSYGTDISWINEVQAVCEDSEWGIPYLNSTDPYQLDNIPDDIALGAAMDKDLWRQAGMWQARLWRAGGVRCLLGPQIDVYSQILGCRLSGSISEDPAVNRDFTAAFAGGLQSTWGDDEATDDQGWGRDSVAAMLKHFVGEGSAEGGRNDHQDPGRYNVFPGDNFEAHLVPFMDGGMNLDSETGQMAAVMPCYGVTYDEDEKYGENVGNGYNPRNLGILRNAGWDGMYCTDWGILTSQTYGVAHLSIPERYAKMVEAGEDQYGGGFMPEIIDEAYQILVDHLGEDGALERVRESARRIAKLMINVQLFDQPYTDPIEAKAMFESDEPKAFGLAAAKRCITMLKNKGGIISSAGLGDKPKVYLPVKEKAQSMYAFMMGDVTREFEMALDADRANELFDVVTDTVENEEIVSASDDDLKDVEYCIVKVANPRDANDGVIGGPSMMGGDDYEPAEYFPITLQYGEYTADGPNVRKESIGHFEEDGTEVNRSYFGKSSLASNSGDLDLVKGLREKLPEGAKIILLVEADNPMVFSEIEPYADVILLAWTMQANLVNEAWASVIAGETEPTGLLQFQMPKDMDTVEASYEDVPRDVEPYVDSEGNTYDFCYGLNWSGVIDDDRVATYNVAPLTKPETEVIYG